MEADDYGYREIGTITPQKWTSKAWAKFQTKTIEFGGRGEISELCIGDYQTWETHWYGEGGISYQDWTAKIGYGSQEVSISLQQEFWFLRCLWQWNVKGVYADGLAIHGGIFLWNQNRDLRLGYEMVGYETYLQREIATFFWQKYFADVLFYGEIGFSPWDAGRFKIGIGKKW